MDAATAQEDDKSSVYLADIKSHTTLGNIDKVEYFEHQNHRGLEVFWAPDSSYCIVENDSRYGADTISILEIKGSSFVQTEIGDHPNVARRRDEETIARVRNVRRRLSVLSIRERSQGSVASTFPK
jgi:hypothetical protein